MKHHRVATTGAALLFALGAFAAAVPAHGEVPPGIMLTSLEWPPYSGEMLPHQGASTAVVSAALASMGERVGVRFYPWNRATALVRGESQFIGYFPEYLSREVESNCWLSDPIGSGPLGLAERSDAPVRWNRLEDLARFKVGVVTGYSNSDRFDDRVRQGLQQVDFASSDRQNLLKLAARRVPLALIDRRVFDYLIRHDRQVAAVAATLRFQARLIETKNLYVCFRRSAEGERARKLFNDGLRKIDIPAVLDAALSGTGGTSVPRVAPR